MLKFRTNPSNKIYPLVNPGSKAAQKGVREGDVISSINGQPTKCLTNGESHALLRTVGETLRLGLNQ
ncbi:Sorbin and SH3 domain-containing protein 1 [Homalodisca vitripennis]|nr:Sorbin and SH3 domain-containing protein 1 [Homalodisca vitripennis]